MPNRKNLAVSFSAEELLITLKSLGADRMIGLDLDADPSPSEREVALVARTAMNALIARGFFKPAPEQQLRLEPTVAGIIGPCVFPEVSVIVTHNRTDRPRELLFSHSARRITVMHTIPLEGIHQFIVVEDHKAIARAIISLVSFDTQELLTDCPPGKLPQSKVTEAKEAAVNGAESARLVLGKTILPKSTAKFFGSALAEPISNTTIIRLNHNSTADNSDGFTIFYGADTLWKLKPNRQDEDLVDLHPISSAQVIEEIKHLLGIV